MPAPLIERLDGAANELHLRVSSPRAAPRMYLYGDERNPVMEATRGRHAHRSGQGLCRFEARAEGLCFPHAAVGAVLLQRAEGGIELRMRLRDPAAGYRMEVVDQSYGIGGLPGVVARPDSMIPFPLMMDSVWVRKTYTF